MMTSVTLDLLVGGGSSSFSYSLSMQNWWEQWRPLPGDGEGAGVELTRYASPNIKTKKYCTDNRFFKSCNIAHLAYNRSLKILTRDEDHIVLNHFYLLFVRALRFSDWVSVVDVSALCMCFSWDMKVCNTSHSAPESSSLSHQFSLLRACFQALNKLYKWIDKQQSHTVDLFS